MVKERIAALISDSAESLGYMVYEYSALIKGENSKITVKIDKVEGITLQDCENYSRRLSLLLDQEQLLSNYSLEISSPGIKRKLRNTGEFHRFIAAPAKVIFDMNGKREVVKGTITSVVGDDVIIMAEKGEVRIPFPMIIQANLDY